MPAKTGVMEQDLGLYNVLTGRASAPRNATTINAALADPLSANKAIYLLPGATWTLNADVTMPRTQPLKIPDGVLIDTNGHTLTVLGGYECGNSQCFTGTGTVIGAGRNGLINVQNFGANPDNSDDDTTAILRAMRSIPGTTTPASQGSGCLYFPLPQTLGGFYKISATLDFTYKFNSGMIAPAILTRGQTDVDATRRATIKWYGPTDTDMILLHNLIGFRFEYISLDGRDIDGVVGLAFGPRLTAVSLVKMFHAKNPEISHCDIGIRHGDYASNGPDVASNTFEDVNIHDNRSAGFAQFSGNGLANFVGHSLFDHNGYAPTTQTHGGEAAALQEGCHVRVVGGNVAFENFVSVSYNSMGVPDPPTIASIVVDSAGIQVYTAWDEDLSQCIVGRGASKRTSVLSAILHYTTLMTDATVPTSIFWQSDNPLLVDGVFFGNIETAAGQVGAMVIDRGVRFLQGAQHELGYVPGFTGTVLSSFLGYAGFPHGASRGRVVAGLPPRTDVGSIAAALELTGREQSNLAVYSTKDVNGEGSITLAMQRSIGKLHTIGNGFFEAGAILSQAAGAMSYFYTTGGDITLGQPGMGLEMDVASAPGQTKFAGGPDHANIVKVLPISTGTTLKFALRIGTQTIAWVSSPPTVGTWEPGDVAFNIAPVTGQPPLWMCSVGGTPGTWKALANIP